MNEIEAIAKSAYMRVGQLISNALHGTGKDLYYVSDEDLLKAVKSYAKALKQARKYD